MKIGRNFVCLTQFDEHISTWAKHSLHVSLNKWRFGTWSNYHEMDQFYISIIEKCSEMLNIEMKQKMKRTSFLTEL